MRFLRKHHNAILKIRAWMHGLVLLAAVCCLDSGVYGYTAFIIAMLMLMWLAVFGYANGYFKEESDEADCTTGGRIIVGDFSANSGRRRAKGV